MTAKAGAATIGLSVCYDVRFPELYRLLALRGAKGARSPSRLHAPDGQGPLGASCCGRGPWRTRPISSPRPEWGRKADGRWTYGRSIIVDPWGTVLSQCPDRDGYALAALDLDCLDRFREEFPALKNRRPEAYDW